MTERVRRAWGYYFRGRLPLPHVAAVLGSDLATIERDALASRSRITTDPPRPPLHSTSPHRDNPAGRPILGGTAAKARALRDLGYLPRRIAELLMLEPALVADFFGRLKRLRGGDGWLDEPRTHREARAALKGIHRAGRQRARQRRAQAWPDRGSCWRTEAAELQAIPPRAARQGAALVVEELAAAPIVAAIPAAPPNPWVGPVTRYARGSQHGRAKLTEENVREVRRLRAQGWSGNAIARKLGIMRSTVYAILAGRTWTHV